MISKTEFILRAAKRGMTNYSALLDADDAIWEEAVEVASLLNSRMPGIGFLSERKRLSCFLSVCGQLDALMETQQLAFDTASLALTILIVTNRDFSKACALFIHRAPYMSWQEAMTFPKMALEFFKGVRRR